MYEIVQIGQDVWMLPKFRNSGHLSRWERLWLNSQKDVLVKGHKIKVQPEDVEAIEDKIGEEMTITEIFERWKDEYDIYTAPSKEHLKCDDCTIAISGENSTSDLCNEHILDL